MRVYHTPVLLREVLEALQVEEGKKYIDATLGGGGHTFEILKAGGKVLGLDVDQDALDYVKNKITNYELRIKEESVVLSRGNFRDIDRFGREQGFSNVNGILFDLGVSSFQLDSGEKGFSFTQGGPLDMRMDKDLSVRAADLVNGLTKNELADLFTRLGEERNAKQIAAQIVIAREKEKIETTQRLVEVIEKAFGVTNEVVSDKRRAQMCMRVFQALRVAVNDELGVLKEALPKALGLLAKNGRLVVITFHSLEDRIVKQTFLTFAQQHLGVIITKKPIIATRQETKENRRSRSAKLRVFEKL